MLIRFSWRFLLFTSLMTLYITCASANPFVLRDMVRQFPLIEKKIDSDRDGSFSISELLTSYYMPGLKTTQYRVISHLIYHFAQLQENNGITLADLQHKASAHTKLEGLPRTNKQDLFWPLIQQKRDPYNLIFPDGLNSIDPDYVHQGMLADCVLISAIASMARTDHGRRKIMDMIRMRRGFVWVQFPGIDQEIQVDPLKLSNSHNILNASTNHHGLWLAILEDAFGQVLLNDLPLNGALEQTGFDEEYWDSHDLYSQPIMTELLSKLILGKNYLLYGIHSHFAGYALTGHYSSSDYIEPDEPQKLRKTLSYILGHSEIVTATITDSSKLYPELARWHTYSILHFDPLTDSVIVRNPWGYYNASYISYLSPTGKFEPANPETGMALDSKNDGVFAIPLKLFGKLFPVIHYSGAAPPEA